MSEILVHLHVDVWSGERPEVKWIQVADTTKARIYVRVIRKRDGKAVQEMEAFSRRKLERVSCKSPGTADYYWLQDDRGPIRDGEPYRLGMVMVMDRIQADMLAAARNVREIQEDLYGGDANTE